MDGKWLSILEYANYKNKSISTVRRYIKAERVKFREDNGKYLIWAKNFNTHKTVDEKATLENRLEIERLKKENRDLKIELSEVKMLIELYETGHMLPKILPETPRTF